jgi:predicted dehydrogenase
MIWLVGAGYMAKEYCKVLTDLGKPFRVIGRGDQSAKAFEAETGVKVVLGGLDKALVSENLPTYIIIATPVEDLALSLASAINAGVPNILIEKPGVLFKEEVEKLIHCSNQRGVNVFVAYNRRFFSSTLALDEMCRLEGGLQSFNFEFTEWADDIASLGKSKVSLDRWVLSNSSHVIDLAFHLGGSPGDMTTYHKGGLEWHPAASYFSGAGVTKNGLIFSYYAGWDSPGRWGLEFITRESRYILRPMEKLHVQKRNSVKIEEVIVEDGLDRLYKPGLFLLTSSFLDSQHPLRCKLCTLEDQGSMFGAYCKIANYNA